jgi:hypothetical protein
MAQDWRDDARQVAVAVAELTSVELKETTLNDRLVEFEYQPANDDAAALSMIVSESQVILSAGKGARFELPSLGESSEEVMRLVRGVAAGGLSEAVDRRGVKFALVLEDGSTISGMSRFPRSDPPELPARIEYRPYSD